MITDKFGPDEYKHQLEVIGAHESRVLILKTAAGAIQKGDKLSCGEDVGRFEFAPPSEFIVSRIVTGTNGNGVLPGFAVVEVCAPPSQMIAGPQLNLPDGG